MKIIDRLIKRSAAFKQLEVEMENKMRAMIIEHRSETVEIESARVDKILDLSTRTHNTIIAFKHSKLERLVPG